MVSGTQVCEGIPDGSNRTLVRAFLDDNGVETFESTIHANFDNNPEGAIGLTDAQKQVTVGFIFTQVNSFRVRYSVTSIGLRNFLFSGQ